jgi:hypothetical protein
MSEPYRPFREPLRNTLLRTVTIAVVLGVVFAFTSGGGVARVPIGILLALWPSLGGHFVELLFLNLLRPLLPANRVLQIAARLAIWFAGGCAIWFAMYWTALALDAPMRSLAWWFGGVAFIGIELVVHAVMHSRGINSFYNGRG